jgi:hypothetical protein
MLTLLRCYYVIPYRRDVCAAPNGRGRLDVFWALRQYADALTVSAHGLLGRPIIYAKLFTSIYQGTLRGNSHGLLVFTNLLAHCDKNGIADIHPRAIAEEVGLTPDEVRLALDVLEAPDPESRSPEEDGRRLVRIDAHRAWGWRIVNYCKYRAIRNEDDRREQNRAAQARFRQQSKPPSAKISQDQPQSAHTEAEAYTEAKKRKTQSTLGVAELVSVGVKKQHAEDWLRARKEKRLPLTLTALDGVKAEAEKAGMTLPQAIAKAAGEGWGGFKASWVTAGGAADPGAVAAEALRMMEARDAKA